MTEAIPQRPDKPPVFATGNERCFLDGLPLRNIHPSGKLIGSGSLRGDCDECKLTTEFDRPAAVTP